MANLPEIFTKANGYLRAALGDATKIITKSQKDTTDAIKNIKIPETNIDPIISGLVDVEDAINKKSSDVNIKNPETITKDLKEGLTEIVSTLKEEIKNFDKEVNINNDFSEITALLKDKKDKTELIKALSKIEKKIQKDYGKDYTGILSDILSKLDNQDVIKELKKLIDKEFKIDLPIIYPVELSPRLIDDYRIRTVLPDEQVNKMSKIIQDSGQTQTMVNAIRDTEENQTDGTQKTQIVDDGGRVASVDDSTNSLQTITYEHHEIHSGSHYYISGHQQFANAQVIDFTIITPNTTKWTHLLFTVIGSGAESVEIYEEATVDTPGTAVTSFNNNRNSINVTGNIIRTGDTFTSTGTLISRRYAGATKSSGTISRGSELVLKQNTTYIFRIKNETNTPNDISWDAEWYEHQDRTS